MLRSFMSRALALGTMVVALNAATASAQTVTAVEYYNKTVDAYFLTARAGEQAALDGVADFQRTGMTFQAVAAASATSAQTKICRFYISVATPFTSSHFYGRQGTDCELLLAQKLTGFTFEDYDFATQQPVGGVCAAGTVGIYRGFRAGANGKTSNHRYSASLASYNTAVAAGYVGEDLALCVTAATAATVTTVNPPVNAAGECGTFIISNKRVTSQSTVTVFGFSSTSTSTIAYDYDLTPVSFNGRSAARQFATTTTAGSSAVSTPGLTFFQNNANDYTVLGSRDSANTPAVDTYFEPPLVYPRKWTTGQKVDYNHAIVFNPSQAIGNGTMTGTTTFLGMESVTVPAGTFSACKFKIDQTTRYPNGSAQSTSNTAFTTWSVPGVGSVKSEGADTSTVAGVGNVVSSYLIVATVVQ